MSAMHPTDINAALVNLVRKRRPAYWQTAAVGLTPALRPILALQDTRVLPAAGSERPPPSILLVGGLRGDPADGPRLLAALDVFAQSAAGAGGVALSAVVAANPDALAGGDWEPAAAPPVDLTGGYPPQDGFYFDDTAPERRYLWRWICYTAPDLLVEVALSDAAEDDAARWAANAAAAGGAVAAGVGAAAMANDDTLAAALGRGADDAPGVLPALRLTVHWSGLTAALATLWRLVADESNVPPAPGRLALEARRRRTPTAIARILADRYGHRLDPVNYTQGVGISGRLRLAAADRDYPDPTAGAAALLGPVARAPAAQLAEAGSAALTGVVGAARLADLTGEAQYRRLFLYAADRFTARGPGQAPAPCDPDFRVEDLFMCGAMLGRAYRITGDAGYADLLAAFLKDGGDVQQDNGLFWHARSVPFYWSRGNGFAALGYAEALTYLPPEHPARAELLRRHRRHLDALLRWQHPSGAFGELVDLPGAWGELTATSMVGYALARGLRNGWLPDADQAPYRRGLAACWRALSERIDDAGGVVDGCVSTGAMPDARAYLHRRAVSGYDDRTGSLALWFACEMIALAGAGKSWGNGPVLE